ncbi:LysR family transcriptional regulator [Marivibrio halodurans]|uniref:LysR family transcriptional regulator n=1 Tax=Marivibrio halodurans TaxID=2039722 RepID=A0A8J7V2I9_9PROT|nr:LysR family transcriptional regulator [Marivibrio halodurans]MBP5856962.1 LysR family transcriptional regulator [Marivibrio halodurans]
MARGLPPLTWIRTFDAAARTGSFTAAAKELSVTQSAVSQQVRLLEAWVGEPLFRRGPRRLSLTPAGHALRPHVVSALDTLETGTRALAGGHRADRVAIRCTAGAAIFLLAPIFDAFVRDLPEISLKVSTLIWPDETADPNCDLEVRIGGESWPGFDAIRLTREAILPVATPERAAIIDGDPKALARALLVDVVGYESGWETWFAAIGEEGPESARRLTLDNEILAMELANQGEAVILGRQSLVARELAAGRLVPVINRRVDVVDGFSVLKPSGDRIGGAAGILLKRILDAFDIEEIPDGWV